MFNYNFLSELNMIYPESPITSTLYNFVATREFLIILCLLTFSLALIGKNLIGMISQILCLLVLWLHFVIFNEYFLLLFLHHHLYLIYKLALFVILVIQLSMLCTVVWQLRAWIKDL